MRYTFWILGSDVNKDWTLIKDKDQDKVIITDIRTMSSNPRRPTLDTIDVTLDMHKNKTSMELIGQLMGHNKDNDI